MKNEQYTLTEQRLQLQRRIEEVYRNDPERIMLVIQVLTALSESKAARDAILSKAHAAGLLECNKSETKVRKESLNVAEA